MIRSILNHIDHFNITNAAGDVFMRRFKILKTRFGNLYLHEIIRSDEDMCLHDHPWRFITLILAGGYTEVLPKGIRWRPPGTFLYRPASFRHRIEVKRPAWSLVWVGPKIRSWGFWTVFGWRPFVPGDNRPICESSIGGAR